MWIISFLESINYLGILLAMFLETYIPLIQSEIVMTFSGYASADGSFNIWLVILAGIIGSELGALSLYFLARLLNREKVIEYLARYGKWLGFDKQDFVKTDDWLEKHQRSTVFFGRFIPGIRSFVAIPAGVHKMNVLEFALLNLFGVAAWVTALAWAGYYLADQYQIVSQYSSYITYGLVIFFLSFIIYRFVRYRISE